MLVDESANPAGTSEQPPARDRVPTHRTRPNRRLRNERPRPTRLNQLRPRRVPTPNKDPTKEIQKILKAPRSRPPAPTGSGMRPEQSRTNDDQTTPDAGPDVPGGGNTVFSPRPGQTQEMARRGNLTLPPTRRPRACPAPSRAKDRRPTRDNSGAPPPGPQPPLPYDPSAAQQSNRYQWGYCVGPRPGMGRRCGRVPDSAACGRIPQCGPVHSPSSARRQR